MELRKRTRAFRDTSGNVAVMAALGATVLISVAGFSVDAAKLFVHRRYAQSVADLAALAAATVPVQATVLANGTVRQNGVRLTETLVVRTGNYIGDPTIASALRFVAGPAATADAVQVTLATETNTNFARFLGTADALTIRTTATAINTAMASFSVGSRLVGLEGGVLNQLLGKALDANLSLSAMDYRALADLRIDAFSFLDELAAKARVTGPTYDSVLLADVKATDALHALVEVASKDPSAKAATVSLLAAMERSAKVTQKIQMATSMELGPYARLSINEHPRTSPSLSALDLLTTMARLADAENQAAAAMSLQVPLLASVTVKMSVGDRPVSSGSTGIGRPGASIATAQTRVLIETKIAPLGLGLISLPIYIDVAKAKVDLAAVTCASPKKVQLSVASGVAEAWIGAIPASTWTGMSPVSTVSPAPLLNLGLLSLTGKAHVRVGSQNPKQVDFTAAEIDAGKVKTVSSSAALESLTGSLIGDLEVGILGLGIVLPGQKKLLTDALSAVAGPLDETIYSVLAFLGVGVGQADVWVDGMRCDSAVLVD